MCYCAYIFTTLECCTPIFLPHAKGFIEVQGTAEGHALQRRELDALLELASVGIEGLLEAQSVALGM